MENNLSRIEKNLRYLAKRYKAVKYSLGLAILFLMMGVGAFSEEIKEVPTREEIATSKENLKNSVGSLQSKIDSARAENEKGLTGLKLELIQLMEQGDQVVKSPWASWQFGANYMYSKWNGTYKGHGDKKEENLVRETSAKRYFNASTADSSTYGTTDLAMVDEPNTEIEVSVAIRPKNVNKQATNIQLSTVAAPTSPQLNIAISSPAPIVTPSIALETINPKIVEPNANPFSDFLWGWIAGNNEDDARGNADPNSTPNLPFMQNFDITGGTFWSGVRPDGTIDNNAAGYKDATYKFQDRSYWQSGNPGQNKIFDWAASRTYSIRHLSIINSHNGRWVENHNTNGMKAGNRITGGTYHVAGGAPAPGYTYTGTEVFHLVGDVHLENVTAHLYGKAAFINAEAFRGGQTTMQNVTVKVHKDNNTIFNIQGDGPHQDATNFRGSPYSTRFGGNANITVDTRNNTTYAVKNFAGGLRIDNTGEIVFNGASNIGVSFLTWVPDKSKYIASQHADYATKGEGSLDNYIPYVKLSSNKPMKLYGDENVGAFFNKKIAGSIYDVGIHQGKFELYFDIGSKLNSNGTGTQTESGQLKGNAYPGYTDKTVDGNVGVYAISGQRTGIDHVPLITGVKNYLNSDLSFYSQDPIHNLNFDKFNITFGKYAKNGFMFLAKNGTVIEIQQGNQAEFSDGINGTNTQEKDTALGTIITYAEGKWTAAGTGLQAKSGSNLEGKSTEIVVDKKLNMMSKKGIGFFARNSGKITVKKDAKAYGYNSILAYADSKGTVEIGTASNPVNITAKDQGVATKSEKYKNIGAYAKAASGSSLTDITSVTVNGNVDINGLGAIADGKGANVYLKGTANKIATGTDGALFAENYGKIEFGGGTITNKDNSTERGLSANDHSSVTPFYARANGRIEFKGATTIDMYDGVLVFGKASDYNQTISSSSTAKYQGTGNITVNLKKNGVNLGVFKGLNNVIWNGNSGITSYVNVLKSVPKFAAINPNGKSFKSTLTEGKMTVNSNVNLSDRNDMFNDITMERELVTIAAGKTVSGTGRGLSMGSNSDAASNAESGYENKGNVNISGGTTSRGVAGINVSYGRILNDSNGNVKVDNGAGLYATNDSRIENKGTVSLTGSGTGIAARGISETKGSATFNYGNTGKIEIVNSGKINIAGKNSIGIYAENNKGIANSNVTINNSGKINIAGENGVGIALKGKNNKGGIVTLSGTGNSDIKLGKKGIGVYAENSDININSNYGIETGDNGVGIYTNRSLTSNKTYNFKYSGSTSGTGIGILFAGANPTNNLKINLNNSTNTTKGIVGIFANGTGTLTNTGDITGTSKGAEFGIVANNSNVVNSGKISLGNANSLSKANVGIYAKAAGKTINNSGDITGGHNTIGLYGYGIATTGKITVGDGGIGVYSQGGNVTVNNTLQVGKKEAVGVFTTGANQNITSTGTMKIGDTSYGFVLKGANTNLNTNNGTVTLGNDSIFAYSSNTGVMTNRTKLVATGSNNYGLYSGGTVRNLADINFGSGIGNVGIYSVNGGTAANGNSTVRPRITVSGSDKTNKIYGIGMAAGYVDENTGVLKSTGNIENYGTIDVFKDNSIGMYAVGRGSTAKNYGTINLSGKKTVGMYLDQGAVGENYGDIQTVPNATNDGIVGVVALNGAVFKNYGNVTINSPNGVGFYGADRNSYVDKGGNINVTGTDSRQKQFGIQNNTGKGVKGVRIVVPPNGSGVTAVRDGKTITPTPLDTNVASPYPTNVTVGRTTLNLKNLNIPSNMGQASELGMYVDTSGVKYTKPIKGIQHLTNLKKVNLVFGPEASMYTSSKDIEIGQNILKPYNDVIQTVSSGAGSLKWGISSASLTWIATVTQSADYTISKLYMSKIPYTSFAKDKDTYNFMDGLEQRYGVEGVGTREKELFNKLNGIGKGEPKLLAQAVDEMRGHQYANTQQRVNATGIILDKEFDYLRNEWQTASKDSNKVKTFGTRGEYKTDTAGIIDYKYRAYGVAYVHENEDIKLGRGIGWYAGIVHNTFKFKDIGKSKEKQLQGKVGLFKSVPFDDNNSLNWTISGDIFVGYNKMHRKFLVVDDIFNAKSRYYNYGIGIKNEIGKEFRLSESFRLRPYAALGLEYGRVSKIREKYGEMKLEVKSNDYISIKPEIGTELVYKQFFGRKTFKVGLGVAYENELGRVAKGKNKARVADTSADWFNIRSEKEDRRGNVKFDLNLGLDNQRYGVTANVGYDTKGENLRGGLGLRVIF